MRALEVASLESQEAFALLGPGHGGGEGWLLSTALSEGAEGPGLWVADFEAGGAGARRFGGRFEAVTPVLPPAPALEVSLDDGGFLGGVAAVQRAIARGGLRQMNFTVRAKVAPVGGAALLAALCRRGVPRFAAWVRLPGGVELVSASPELFFEVRDGVVRVEPMKGTAPPDGEAALRDSPKEQAELALVTEMMRGELQALCEPGTVEVACARRFLRLPYAVQAVSDVTGRLRAGAGVREVLAALHPGASVSGTPRVAARALIAALETTPRRHYCGSLGLEADGVTRVSLLIRTAERDADGGWTYGVGCGITGASVPEAELAEARLKLGALG